jgi:hypothetical protein
VSVDDEADGEVAGAAADVHFVEREAFEASTGVQGQLLGDDELEPLAGQSGGA